MPVGMAVSFWIAHKVDSTVHGMRYKRHSTQTPMCLSCLEISCYHESENYGSVYGPPEYGSVYGPTVV